MSIREYLCATMKKPFRLLAIFVLLGAVAFAASSYPDISQDQLKQAIADKSVVLLDANGSDSFKSGHIPGAIDFDSNQDHLASLLPADKNTLIVAYCGGEQCTAYKAAAAAAVKLGYTNVKHFAPGISGWKNSGQPTEPGA
jgi:rhodanese-related sulfurtransferase